MQPVKLRLTGALAFLAGLTAQAAEFESVSQPIQYEAAFFEKFSPRTALDMVEHVPSFAPHEVDEERRGFLGAAGNVLIDGRQPSAKSQPLEDILQRIPAAQVLRIEVLRGTEMAGDASGGSILVNVVRTPSAGTGVWSTGFEYAQQHELAPNGYLSWAGRIGQTEYGLGARGYSLRRELPGTRRLTTGTGELTELAYETSPREFEEYALDGELSRDLFGGRLRATGQIYHSRYHQASTLERRSVDGTLLGDELAPYSESDRRFELGTHFESAIASWRWTLAAILTRSRYDSDSHVTRRNSSHDVDSEFRQFQIRETGESIVRATLERPLGSVQQLQFGLEGTLNTLDADLDPRGSFGGGAEAPIEIPNADMRVEEKRCEFFALHTWRGKPWSTEARLAAEYSRLDFAGDVSQTVDLAYLKPSVQLARQMGQQHQLHARVSREVGQLDFADFASVASLSDDRIDGGNPDLMPQTSWRVELGMDLRLGAQAALAARVYHAWIDDVVDFVPLGDPGSGIVAPGNIGTGELDGLQLTFAAPLSPVIAGGTLKLDATLQEASVIDPLTGRARTISEFARNRITAEFRQDIERHGFAWGVKYVHESSQIDYRMNETDRTRKSPSLDMFVERKVFNRLKLTFSVVSVQDSPELRTRFFYDGDRNGALLGVEDTTRRPGRWALVTLSGTL